MAQDDNTFEVVLRGQSFTLTRAQIQSEPGCLFENALLGDFAEAGEKKLVLDRHPATFSLILDHLSGYRVLPLDDDVARQVNLAAPRLLRYLRDDADYYGLERLAQLLKEDKAAVASPASVPTVST